MTDNMKKRKALYDTHSLHKKDVVHIVESDCPLRLETCVRAMLYKDRYKDKKDQYVCGLQKVKKALEQCIKSIECIEQTGGSNYIDNSIDDAIDKYVEVRMKLKEVQKDLNKKK